MQRFLASKEVSHPQVAIIGLPYDATATFRRGARFAPAAIRWASWSIESYSPVLNRDLENLCLQDFGDVELPDPPEEMIESVMQTMHALPEGCLPLLLGGEHTITLGAVRALARRYPRLAVLNLDAHLDMRDRYEGKSLSHATVMRRLAEELPGSLVQLGVRSGVPEEFEAARRLCLWSSPYLFLPPSIYEMLRERPIYLTVDIDVLDPAYAPGTGNPEPEGLSAHELLRFLRHLQSLHVVGMDVVEVSPPYDPSGMTAVLAAKIAREAILCFVPHLSC
ncbi:MAG: agmatinase [Armatimonadota bacterium]|nr:agmatinase [Armatimonadota bacterium]